MHETLGGLGMAGLTALVFYIIGRRRYRCPHCGRIVRWREDHCPHCREDMRGRHRAGPPPRRSRNIGGNWPGA